MGPRAPRPGTQGPASPQAPAETTRWLTAEQQLAWRSFLLGSALLTHEMGRVLTEGFDLSLAEYEVLVRLSESPDNSLRMSDLADELVHSRSRITYTVRVMERRGLVARRSCAQDGRGVWCTLTAEGRDLLGRAAPVHVASVRAALVDVLTDAQLADLGRAMGAVASHLGRAPAIP